MATRKGEKWSAQVTKHSDALTWRNMSLKPTIPAASPNPSSIAKSLKRSAERSPRRKAGPFQSAMSMLNFYINRAGKNLTAERKRVLERAKDELRKAFGRKPE
jgi:hypothetical protein